MEKELNKARVFFREEGWKNGKSWHREFESLEGLKNYLKFKTIQRLSLRTFVDGLGKLMTIKSHITPNELTQDNYSWLQDDTASGNKFIVVNYRKS